MTSSDKLEGEGVAIPAGMVPWLGGDRAPDDWDGGPVWLRRGELFAEEESMTGQPLIWGRPYAAHGSPWDHGDILAYTARTPQMGDRDA